MSVTSPETEVPAVAIAEVPMTAPGSVSVDDGGSPGSRGLTTSEANMDGAEVVGVAEGLPRLRTTGVELVLASVSSLSLLLSAVSVIVSVGIGGIVTPAGAALGGM